MDKEKKVDWGMMRGYAQAKYVLEVAASGNHSTLLVGPPNTGKTTIAQSLETILPEKPCVAPLPHTDNLPDAMERARGGILFLNHLERWDDASLVLLREMIVQHPGAFLLIGTARYCPCGKNGDEAMLCVCSQEIVDAYQRRLRETIHTIFALEVFVSSINRIATVYPEETSRMVRERVEAARCIQYQRNEKAKLNSALSWAELEELGPLETQGQELQALAWEQLALSSEQRLYLRQVARTIADLAASPHVSARDMAKAIQFRPRWGRKGQQRE